MFGSLMSVLPSFGKEFMTPLSGLIHAMNALASVLYSASLRIDETGRSYFYDTAEEKRWLLGDGGKAGNCDECSEAEDLGWVDMDYTYDMFYEDVDGPPGHPNCFCVAEQRTRRYRVYESSPIANRA